MAELTAKQKRFVEEYLICLNATEAARKAGYSEKTARSIGAENLTKPDIQHAIQAALNSRQKRTQVDQDYVLSNLTEIVERCMQRAPVTQSGIQITDGDGNGVWEFDARPAVSALKLLGEHLGMFEQTVRHSGKVAVTVTAKDLTDDEILTLLSRGVPGFANGVAERRPVEG